MIEDIQTCLKSSEGHALAKEAIGLMQAQGVWPTPHNYEIWLHVISEPQSPLAQEVRRLAETGANITEDMSANLVKTFLQSRSADDDDESLMLTQELTAVDELTTQACQTQKTYGRVLEAATQRMSFADREGIKALVSSLTQATDGILTRYATLESQLSDVTAEASQLRGRLNRIRMESTTDALTGLANRKALDETLARMSAEIDDDGDFTLAFIDIDHFKRFNDTWGHQTGDQVLRFIGGILAENCKAPRFAARYGGEEFLILFPNEDACVVGQMVNRLRDDISTRRLMRRATNTDLGMITISAGIAQRLPGEYSSDWISRADRAMYRSKQAGRNRITMA